MFVLAQVRACRQRREHGFAVEDFEVGFLKDFVGLQGLLLFAIVMNGFRGIPLSLVILGVVALLVYVVTQHTPFGRYLYAIGDNEEAAALSGIPRILATSQPTRERTSAGFSDSSVEFHCRRNRSDSGDRAVGTGSV